MPGPRGFEPSTEVVERLCEGTRYTPVRFLGWGGMGQIWVVRHGFLRREFALKLLHPRLATKPHVVDRLRLEAQATARIDHPGIVQVIDFWMDHEGRACFVMELLNGQNIAEELKQRERLPVLEVLEIGCQMLSALAAAHSIGVIHRDIKPENVLLHHLRGQGRIAKLLDFGLARVIADYAVQTPAPPMQHTRTGARVGTPRYLSPEAARGGSVDHRSDIYCVGLTLYEALTGTGPFDKFTDDPVDKPSDLAQGVSSELDACILRSLEQDAADRFQSATEFELALRSLLPLWHKAAFRPDVDSGK